MLSLGVLYVFAVLRAAGEGLESGSLHLDARERAELLDTIRIETARLERLVSSASRS